MGLSPSAPRRGAGEIGGIGDGDGLQFHSPPVMPSLFSSSSEYEDPSEDEEVMDEGDEVSESRRTRRIWNEVDEEDEDLEEYTEEEEAAVMPLSDEEVMDEDDEVSESRTTRRIRYQVDEEDDDYEEEEEEDLRNDSVHEHEQGSHEQASAVAAAGAPAPAPPGVRVRTRTAVANVTVCDADALDCGVCFLTLRPPIFQCEVGHVVCSACRDKLEATGNGKCHVCRVATRGGGYRRCHAMEHLLDCIRVPCPYAGHGCDATPPYHGQQSHRQVCPHAPCRCPGESCGFIGSTATLLDHFAGAHNWPCTTKVRAREAFSIRLHVGFNFILLRDQDRDDREQAAATGSLLFLLNVTQERLGLAISVLWIHPHATANVAQQLLSTQCELVFSRFGDRNSCHSYHQSSVFGVMCTDLTNGLPNPEGCFQFFVHNTVLGDGDDKNSIQVKARIIN